MKKFLYITLAMLASVSGVMAQAEPTWLENTMYASGKINVVIGVGVIMFLVLVGYMVSIDRKLKKLEEGDK